MGYSLKFRKEVIKFREDRGLTVKETSELFGVNPATIFRWLKKIEPCETRNKPATKIDMEALEKDVQDNPDSYLSERAERLKVSRSCVYSALKRLNISYKKKSKTSKSK
jgi:transposase